MPPRSRLYSLKPYGLGTGNVESLTSFITRLADAHCVPVWMLVSREVAPLISAEMLKKKSGTCDLFKSLGSAINGNNGTALRMTEVISELTGLHREVFRRIVARAKPTPRPRYSKINEADGTLNATITWPEKNKEVIGRFGHFIPEGTL